MFNNRLVKRILDEQSQERKEWAIERRELLNRIAKPEQVFLPPSNGDSEILEPSKDEIELAYVGQEVPATFRAPED